MRIIDSHTHLMEDGFQYLPGLPLNEFVNLMDDAGIDVSVIFTLAGLIRDFRAHNDELAEAVSEYPDRLVGLGSVNPWYGNEAVEEVRRCFTDLGFAGLKLHPWYTGFLVNSPVMDSVCEVVAEVDKPVFLHTGTPPGSAPLQVGALASRHPRVVFVLGHLGLPDLWTEAVAAARRHRNIYLETAGAHSLSIRKAVEILGPERVLFGSDSPFGGKNNVFFQRDKVSLLGLPELDEKRIMSLNAAEIFDVPTAYEDAS